MSRVCQCGFMTTGKLIYCHASQLLSCSVTSNTGCAAGDKNKVEEMCLTGPASRAPLRPLTRGPGRTTRWAPAMATTSTSSPLCPKTSRTRLFCWAESFNPPISTARTLPHPNNAVFSASITTCLARMCSAWQCTSGPRLQAGGTLCGYDMETKETCGTVRLFTSTVWSLSR